MEALFEDVAASVRDGRLQRNTTLDKAHGCIETPKCVVTQDVSALAKADLHWPGLCSVAIIGFTHEAFGSANKGERSTEWRYHVGSLRADAANFNAKVLAHWGIENGCYWVLNVTFNEDDCRISRGDGAQDFATLRRVALNSSNTKSPTRPVCASSA